VALSYNWVVCPVPPLPALASTAAVTLYLDDVIIFEQALPVVAPVQLLSVARSLTSPVVVGTAQEMDAQFAQEVSCSWDHGETTDLTWLKQSEGMFSCVLVAQPDDYATLTIVHSSGQALSLPRSVGVTDKSDTQVVVDSVQGKLYSNSTSRILVLGMNLDASPLACVVALVAFPITALSSESGACLVAVPSMPSGEITISIVDAVRSHVVVTQEVMPVQLPVSISEIAPTQLFRGDATILRIFGTQFAVEESWKCVVGFVELPARFVSENEVICSIPSHATARLPLGEHTVSLASASHVAVAPSLKVSELGVYPLSQVVVAAS
jgi:hypothetical protein